MTLSLPTVFLGWAALVYVTRLSYRLFSTFPTSSRVESLIYIDLGTALTQKWKCKCIHNQEIFRRRSYLLIVFYITVHMLVGFKAGLAVRPCTAPHLSFQTNSHAKRGDSFKYLFINEIIFKFVKLCLHKGKTSFSYLLVFFVFGFRVEKNTDPG
jgi:hypothetical protein